MERSVLIVGAGTFGTSTAYHLARSYKDASRVMVIDQAPSPPKQSAAIDINRIVRTDYPNSLYCNLANQALHDWFWSIDLQRYFHMTGWVMMDDTDESGEGSLSSRVRAVFKERGADPTDDIPLDQLASRWDVMEGTDTKGFHTAYFNPEAGWCDAALATANLMAAAENRGVKRVTSRATELLFDDADGRVNGVRASDGQVFEADVVLLATGAWSSSLLSPVEDALDIPNQDRIERQVQATGRVAAYYAVSDDDVERCSKSKMPVICYGLRGEVIPPSKQNKTITYRNSETTFTNTVETGSGKKITVPRSSDAEDQMSVPEGLKRATEAIVTSKAATQLADRGKEADHWRICWDALTPTEDFLMCRYPHEKLSNLYLAVGGSFHSYKFLPVVGKYMMNILEGKSNGAEKYKAWAWKWGEEWKRIADEQRSQPRRELRIYEEEEQGSQHRAKL